MVEPGADAFPIDLFRTDAVEPEETLTLGTEFGIVW